MHEKSVYRIVIKFDNFSSFTCIEATLVLYFFHSFQGGCTPQYSTATVQTNTSADEDVAVVDDDAVREATSSWLIPIGVVQFD